MLEIYHITLLEWWRSRLTWRGRPIPVVFATPDRAFADMRTLLDASRGDQGTAARRDENIPLPFASLSEAGLEEYDGRRDNAGAIRGMYVDQELRKGVNVDWPTPVNLPYQLDVWCETRGQLRKIIAQARRLFKLQLTYVEVNFQSPRWIEDGLEVPPEVLMLGRRQVALNTTGWTDASKLETQEERREIRASLSMVLTAWMGRGYTEVPLAREIRTEIHWKTDGSALTAFVAEPPENIENGP